MPKIKRNPAEELLDGASGGTLFELPALNYIHVRGDRACAFLQGQLTCDVNKVSPTQVRQGALCNLKGRILALMDVLYVHSTYGLVLPRDLNETVQKDLRLGAQLSRVHFEVSTTLKCYGLYLPKSTLPPALPFDLPTEPLQMTHSTDFVCYAIDVDLYIILGPLDVPLKPAISGGNHWHALLLSRHHPTLYPNTIGKFLPQQLQLDQTPTVSFDKGCYKGQEIIARMYYRGINKYRLLLTTLQHDTPIHPGMIVLSASGKETIGEIIDVAVLDTHTSLILSTVLQTHEQAFLNHDFIFN